MVSRAQISHLDTSIRSFNNKKMNKLKHERFGFSYERGGVHTARTMMLVELRALLSFVEKTDAPKSEYLDAIQTANCLGKRSGKTRVLTFRHLVDLYSLDPNHMTVAREEIFGPVLVIIDYETLDEAVAIANDTPYGLAAYVSGTDVATMHGVANRLRAGQVNLNSAPVDMMAPFGGFKQSGNGREWGDVAFGEFLENKAVLGHSPSAK